MVNSRQPLVTATPFSSRREVHHLMEAHLIPRLRCQFAEFLNHGSLKRLGILSPPTCVGFRYGHPICSTRGFSWKHGITQLLRIRRLGAFLPSALSSRFDPTSPAYRLETGISITRLSCPSPSPLDSTQIRRCRNINLLSIAYAFRPRLRSRLTLGGLTCPRNPWVFGERVSHPFNRYSCWHNRL